MAGRRPILFAGLALTAALALAAVWWSVSLRRTRLRVENLSKLSSGMTRAEVADLLGGPPGNYGWSNREAGEDRPLAGFLPRAPAREAWFDDAVYVEFYFDNEDRVTFFWERPRFGETPPGVHIALRRMVWRNFGF